MADKEKDEKQYMTLEFDNGDKVECEIMGVFDAGDKEYIALIPENGSDDVYIYGYEEEEFEKGGLTEIEDDEEFEKAVKAFEEIVGAED